MKLSYQQIYKLVDDFLTSLNYSLSQLDKGLSVVVVRGFGNSEQLHSIVRIYRAINKAWDIELYERNNKCILYLYV